MPVSLTIVTPTGEAYRGEVHSVVLPGSEGEFGVLENHERFLTSLRVGEIEVSEPGATRCAAIGGGFAEVGAGGVVVLVDSCELAGDIDLARAELARDRAEQGLAALGADENADRRRHYEEALERAHNRIAVAQRRV